MSQLNAAIGLAQLPHFPETRARRKQLWKTYASALKDVPAARLVDADVEHSVPSMCTVLVPDRDRVFQALHAQGVGVGTHYPPNHRQRAFSAWHRPLPVTEKIGQEILTLPFHQRMTADDVSLVVSALQGALR
jgi:perosamine synthetase